MNFPQVKLKLVLEIDNLEDIVDSIDYTEMVKQLFRENNQFTIEQVRDYVIENNPHIKYDT